MSLPPHPEGYVCKKVSHRIELTGRLSDPAWADAPWTRDFQDIEGDKKPKPDFRTRVKMLWDDECFYVGAELEEPHVWGTLVEHDSVIFHDNDFEVFIDPDGDNHQYYEYEINALGTDWDLRLVKPYRDGGPALNEWEIPGLRKAVHIAGTLNEPSDTDLGWTLELAFPWSVLKQFSKVSAPPQPGDQWRVNFSRVEWDVTTEGGKYGKVKGRPEHNWVWSPQGAIDMHRPEMWGYVQFEEDDREFVRDPDWEVKCRLMQVYWAQRKHFEKTKTYARTAQQLRLKGVQIEHKGEGYVARMSGVKGAWTVRQDSLLALSD